MVNVETSNNYISLSKKIGNFVSNIILGETKEFIISTAVKVGGIEKDLDEVKLRLYRIEDRMDRIDDRIYKLDDKISGQGLDIQGLKIHTQYGVSNSPTIPNDLGKELLEKSQFNLQYPKIKNKLFMLLDTMNLRTLYDYEKGAYKALERLENDPDIDPIKDYVVNHPEESLELIFKIASWRIRDDYKIHISN